PSAIAPSLPSSSRRRSRAPSSTSAASRSAAFAARMLSARSERSSTTRSRPASTRASVSCASASRAASASCRTSSITKLYAAPLTGLCVLSGRRRVYRPAHAVGKEAPRRQCRLRSLGDLGLFCWTNGRSHAVLASALYPSYLNPGDNAWQMTAATLVGLMSIPGLVVLYGGVMQKRWSVNSMMLAFIAFAIILVEWVLYGYKMGFGNPWHGLSHSGFFGNFIGQPGDVLGHKALQGQGNIPLV